MQNECSKRIKKDSGQSKYYTGSNESDGVCTCSTACKIFDVQEFLYLLNSVNMITSQYVCRHTQITDASFTAKVHNHGRTITRTLSSEIFNIGT